LLDWRKVPELAEEFAPQGSQKLEIPQILSSWRWMHSGSNRSHPVKFPDNRENTGNFARFGPVNLILRAQSVSSSKDLSAKFPA
jgi:hypothetical protein